MERILVGMDGRNGAWEALSRALALARRIEARVYALLVLPPAACGTAGFREKATGVRARLEQLLRTAKAEGIPVEYFLSEGNYEEEVVRFVEHNKITLFVAEPRDGEVRTPDRGLGPIGGILRRISCRVELVSPRKSEGTQPTR